MLAAARLGTAHSQAVKVRRMHPTKCGPYIWAISRLLGIHIGWQIDPYESDTAVHCSFATRPCILLPVTQSVQGGSYPIGKPSAPPFVVSRVPFLSAGRLRGLRTPFVSVSSGTTQRRSELTWSNLAVPVAPYEVRRPVPELAKLPSFSLSFVGSQLLLFCLTSALTTIERSA